MNPQSFWTITTSTIHELLLRLGYPGLLESTRRSTRELSHFKWLHSHVITKTTFTSVIVNKQQKTVTLGPTSGTNWGVDERCKNDFLCLVICAKLISFIHKRLKVLLACWLYSVESSSQQRNGYCLWHSGSTQLSLMQIVIKWKWWAAE